jgi:hypothetical protein
MGGDWVDTPLPLPLAPDLTPAPAAVVSGIVAANQFGFMTMQRDGGRWTMTARGIGGNAMSTCVLNERRADCVPGGWLDGNAARPY